MKKVELELGGLTEYATGTTGNAYASVLKWPCIGIGKKTIVVENTGSESMTLRVYSRAYPGGIDLPAAIYNDEAGDPVYTRALEAGDIQPLRFNNAYAELEVQLKSTVEETPTTYQVDYNGVIG
jgi:hypothetical protein